MAVNSTPRLGLPTYSSGDDAHPGRVQFNDRQNLLDGLVAIATQGSKSDRPTASVKGRLYYATDESRLYWDDGGQWLEVTNLGGGGAGAPVVVNGSAVEGSSGRAARADHTHNLVLASASANGAMTSQQFSLVSAATNLATESTIVRRDSNGRTNFLDPVTSQNAATKGYVDNSVKSSSLPSQKTTFGYSLSLNSFTINLISRVNAGTVTFTVNFKAGNWSGGEVLLGSASVPAGWRPTGQDVVFPAFCKAADMTAVPPAAYMTVKTSGDVTVWSAPNSSYASREFYATGIWS